MRKRRKRAKERILSFLLSLVMVLGMVDTSALAAFAAEPEEALLETEISAELSEEDAAEILEADAEVGAEVFTVETEDKDSITDAEAEDAITDAEALDAGELDELESQTIGPYDTPTNLKWGDDYSASWKIPTDNIPDEEEYELDYAVYRVDGDELLWETSPIVNNATKHEKTEWFKDYITDEGPYYFTVVIDRFYGSSGNPDRTKSEIAKSEKLTYIIPTDVNGDEQILGETTAEWDDTVPSWVNFDEVEGADRYRVELFKNGKFAASRTIPAESGQETYSVSLANEVYEAGNGSFNARVCALSDDIQKVANGPVGEFSDPYVVNGTQDELGAPPENPKWEGFAATWTKNDRITTYDVFLYYKESETGPADSDHPLGFAQITENGVCKQYLYNGFDQTGYYNFSVQARFAYVSGTSGDTYYVSSPQPSSPAQFIYYERPQEELAKAVITPEEDIRQMTFAPIEDAIGYEISMINVGQDRAMGNIPVWTDEIGSGPYGSIVKWADAEHTKILVDYSVWYSEDEYDAGIYYWTVRAISGEPNKIANGQIAESEKINFAGVGHFRVSYDGGTDAEFHSWDDALAYMNELDSSENDYVVTYINPKSTEDRVNISILPDKANSITLQNGENVKATFDIDTWGTKYTYPVNVEANFVVDEDESFADLTISGKDSVVNLYENHLTADKLTIGEGVSFKLYKDPDSGKAGHITVSDTLTGVVSVRELGGRYEEGDVILTGSSDLDIAAVDTFQTKFDVVLEDNGDNTKSIKLAAGDGNKPFKITHGSTQKAFATWAEALAYMNDPDDGSDASANDYVVVYANPGTTWIEPKLTKLPENAKSLTLGLGMGINYIVDGYDTEQVQEISYPVIIKGSVYFRFPVEFDTLYLNDSTAYVSSGYPITVRKLEIQGQMMSFDMGFITDPDSYEDVVISKGSVTVTESLKGKIHVAFQPGGLGGFKDGDVILTMPGSVTEDQIIDPNIPGFTWRLKDNSDGTKSLVIVEQSGKYDAPINLDWDGFFPTWELPASIPDSEEIYVGVNLYNKTTGKSVTGGSLREHATSLDAWDDKYWWTDSIYDEGEYYFTVHIMPGKEDSTKEWSEIVASESKRYTRPADVLDVPSAPVWSEDTQGAFKITAVDGAYNYMAELLKENEKKEFAVIRELPAGTNMQNLPDGSVFIDLSESLRFHGAGKYKVRIRALSKDIETTGHSAYGELSEIYDTTGGAEDPVDPVIPKYTVSFNTLGHGSVKSATVNEGGKVTKPADPSATGLKFGGWYRDKEYTSAWDFAVDTVDADTELFAKWTEVPVCTVSFNLLGHGKEIASVKVNKDEAVNAPAAPSEEGYEFGGWHRDKECTDVWKFTNSVSSDMILYAKWTKVERYTVSFDLQGHGEAVAAVSVNAGGKVTEPAKPAAEGFTFGGWYKEKECTNAWNFAADTVSANTTLYAKWTEAEKAPVSYVVTFDLQGHGEAIASVSVNEGSEVTEPAKPSAEGYIFGGWFREKACTTEWKFKGSVSADTVSANVTLYAKWTEEKKEDPVNTETTVTPEDKDDTTYEMKLRKDLKTEGAAIGNINAKTYDGKPYLPTVKVTASVGGKTVTLTEGADYRVLYKNNVNAGTGTVIVKGNGLYTGEITKDFTISKKPIGKLKVVTGGLSVNSTAAAPVYVYDGGTLLKAGVDYDVTKPDTSAKGAPKVTITAKAGSNYDGSRTAVIKVYDSAKVLSAGNITLKNPADVSLDYTGKALKPEVVVTFNEKPLEKGEYTVKYTNNKEAGTAFITVTGKKGYAGSAVLTFTIKPVAKTFGDAALKDVTYSGKAQKPKMKVTVDGKTLKMGKDYVLLYSDNVHAGKGKVTVKGLGNYAGTPAKTYEFIIRPQDIKKASVKGTKDKLEVSFAKKTILEGTDFTAAYGAENKGKVEVTLTGKGDFAGTATKKVKAN